MRQFQVPAWLLPSPSLIAQSMVEWRSELVGHSMVTLYETLVGFALSIAISVPLAVAVVYSPLLQNTIYPILLALQSMPKVAIAPLLALWIGFGTLPKIVVVFLVCFFPIIVATASGLAAVPTPLMDLIRSLSASSLQTFVKIRFPTAMPHIFVGPQDRHHVRSHRRGDRRIRRVGKRARISHSGVDVAVAHAARVRLAGVAHAHEHRALLRHRAD